MLTIVIGALLVVGGVVYLASEAIWRGRMSGAGQSSAGTRTLEPPRRGVAFLGLRSGNLPGVIAVVLGAILLLAGGWL